MDIGMDNINILTDLSLIITMKIIAILIIIIILTCVNYWNHQTFLLNKK